jgi:hypothetical protein
MDFYILFLSFQYYKIVGILIFLFQNLLNVSALLITSLAYQPDIWDHLLINKSGKEKLIWGHCQLLNLRTIKNTFPSKASAKNNKKKIQEMFTRI